MIEKSQVVRRRYWRVNVCLVTCTSIPVRLADTEEAPRGVFVLSLGMRCCCNVVTQQRWICAVEEKSQ